MSRGKLVVSVLLSTSTLQSLTVGIIVAQLLVLKHVRLARKELCFFALDLLAGGGGILEWEIVAIITSVEFVLRRHVS